MSIKICATDESGFSIEGLLFLYGGVSLFSQLKILKTSILTQFLKLSTIKDESVVTICSLNVGVTNLCFVTICCQWGVL